MKAHRADSAKPMAARWASVLCILLLSVVSNAEAIKAETIEELAEWLPISSAGALLAPDNTPPEAKAIEQLPPFFAFILAPQVRAAGPAMIAPSRQSQTWNAVISISQPTQTARRVSEQYGWTVNWVRRERGEKVADFAEVRPPADVTNQQQFIEPMLYFASLPEEGLLAVTTNPFVWARMGGNYFGEDLLGIEHRYRSMDRSRIYEAFIRRGNELGDIVFAFHDDDRESNPRSIWRRRRSFDNPSTIAGTIRLRDDSLQLVADFHAPGDEMNALAHAIGGTTRHTFLANMPATFDGIVTMRVSSAANALDAWLSLLTDHEFRGSNFAVQESEADLNTHIGFSLREDLLEQFGDELAIAWTNDGAWRVAMETDKNGRAEEMLIEATEQLGGAINKSGEFHIVTDQSGEPLFQWQRGENALTFHSGQNWKSGTLSRQAIETLDDRAEAPVLFAFGKQLVSDITTGFGFAPEGELFSIKGHAAPIESTGIRLTLQSDASLVQWLLALLVPSPTTEPNESTTETLDPEIEQLINDVLEEVNHTGAHTN